MRHSIITAAPRPGLMAARVPSFYLPHAKSALAEAITDIEHALDYGTETRAAATAEFVIQQCEYAIARMRTALEQQVSL